MSKKITVEKWQKRVAEWRASGQSAKEFSKGQPWAPKTLRWYASRLKRRRYPSRAPVVRVAQLIRTSGAERGGTIVVEALDSRLRITIGAGAEQDMAVAMLGAIASKVSS